jgi:hypothetical protein
MKERHQKYCPDHCVDKNVNRAGFFAVIVMTSLPCLNAQELAGDAWIPFGSGHAPMAQAANEPEPMSYGDLHVEKNGARSTIILGISIPGAMLSYPDDNGLLAGKYASLSLASDDIKLMGMNYNGSLQPEKLGTPDLPLVRVQVRIPYNARLANVTTTNTDFLPVEGEYAVNPVQEQLVESFVKGVDIDSRIFRRDAVIYAKNALFTHPLTFESMICHGIRFLEITYCPLKYNPISKKLLATNNADIVINYTLENISENEAPNPFTEAINSVTFNGTGLPDQAESAPSEGKFIVVSKSSLINTPTFTDYIAYRESQGYTLVESVNADNMNVAAITAKIKSLYSSSKMDYVIILGDETIIPIPVDGTNYHYKVWSRLEGTDNIEDVGLGIFLCDNEARFKNIVQHQKWQEAGGAWSKTQLTTSGSEVTNGTWNRFSSGHYGTIHLDKPDGGSGYTVHRVYGVKTIPTKYGGSNMGLPIIPFESWTTTPNPFYTSGAAGTAEIIKQWNAGVLNVSHRDHGSISGPSSPPMSYSMFGGTAPKITSTCSPFFSSLNCLTGNFKGHHSNNFAYLAQASQYGTCTNIGATVVTYSGDNDYVHVAMYAAMYPKTGATPITNVGQIWLVAHMKGQTHSRTYFHIYGDPMTNLSMGQSGSKFITLMSPNGGEAIEAGATYGILWGDNISGNVKIELIKGTSVLETLAPSIASNGSYQWTVGPDVVPGNDYKIKVTSLDSTALFDQSTSSFSIVTEYFVAKFPFIETCDTLDSATTELPYKWDQPSTNQLPWVVCAGPTPSRVGNNPNRTGPMGDHTSGKGNYIYMEASGNFNEKGDFSTPKFSLNNLSDPQLSFWYHMFSDTNVAGAMGSMYLDINVDGIWKDSVVKLTGDHGDRWIRQTVNLKPYKGNRIFFRFRGVTGSLFTSDICLDDFNVGQADITASDSRQGRITAAFDLVKMGSGLAFHVPEASASFAQVKIVLYNLQGRKVATLFSGRARPGVNLIRLDAHGHALGHGIYQCRMEAAGFVKTVAVMPR